jgi:hypothetical protein
MRKTPYKTYPIRMRERAVERLLLGESATTSVVHGGKRAECVRRTAHFNSSGKA